MRRRRLGPSVADAWPHLHHGDVAHLLVYVREGRHSQLEGSHRPALRAQRGLCASERASDHPPAVSWAHCSVTPQRLSSPLGTAAAPSKQGAPRPTGGEPQAVVDLEQRGGGAGTVSHGHGKLIGVHVHFGLSQRQPAARVRPVRPALPRVPLGTLLYGERGY